MTARWEKLFAHGFLAVFSFVAIYPIVAIVLIAFNRPGVTLDGFALPSAPTLSSFAEVWHSGFASALRASLIVAVSVVLSSILLSIPAGYAFGTMRFRGSKVIFYLMMTGIIVPYEALVVPLYYDLRKFQLTDTYWSLILPQVGLSVAFGTFWLRAFFLSAPRPLIEAARLDGANSWSILWRVLTPLARPALLTLAALLFVFTWNDFLLALVMIQDPAKRTAPLVLNEFSGTRFGTDLPLVAAAACLVALPPALIYVFLQRQFIRGMLSGATNE